MTKTVNHLGQPIGQSVPGWQACPDIPHAAIDGLRCTVTPLSTNHTADLHAAFAADTSGALWTYMPVGPFADVKDYAAWVAEAVTSADPLFFTIIEKATGKPVGVASYLRMKPEHGVAEVGYITFSPALQRTAIATEAMFLMMKQAFDLGYRRHEWKCDALNAASRRAAERLGFTYEGTFLQAMIYKGRNRDTAWFAITDLDWPKVRAAHEAWLDPGNFDDAGQQRSRLSVG